MDEFTFPSIPIPGSPGASDSGRPVLERDFSAMCGGTGNSVFVSEVEFRQNHDDEEDWWC